MKWRDDETPHNTSATVNTLRPGDYITHFRARGTGLGPTWHKFVALVVSVGTVVDYGAPGGERGVSITLLIDGAIRTPEWYISTRVRFIHVN